MIIKKKLKLKFVQKVMVNMNVLYFIYIISVLIVLYKKFQ